MIRRGIAALASLVAAGMFLSVPVAAQATGISDVASSASISRATSRPGNGGGPSVTNPTPLDVSGIKINVNGESYAGWSSTTYDYYLCNAYPNGASVSFSNVPSDWKRVTSAGNYDGHANFSIFFTGKNTDGVLMSTRTYYFDCATLDTDIPEFTTPSTPTTTGRTWSREGVAWSAPASGGLPVYRLYNPVSGQHHYTMDAHEKDVLSGSGWRYEKIAFNADTEGKPVYRLYNPRSGEHHYTMDSNERDVLVDQQGWRYEGVAWSVGDSSDVPVYRVHNPRSGEHLWTTDYNEYQTLGNTVVDPQPAPSPSPSPSPTPQVQHGITPGAFCSPQGATGIGKKNGLTYTCKPDNSGILRWRR